MGRCRSCTAPGLPYSWQGPRGARAVGPGRSRRGAAASARKNGRNLAKLEPREWRASWRTRPTNLVRSSFSYRSTRLGGGQCARSCNVDSYGFGDGGYQHHFRSHGPTLSREDDIRSPILRIEVALPHHGRYFVITRSTRKVAVEIGVYATVGVPTPSLGPSTDGAGVQFVLPTSRKGKT